VPDAGSRPPRWDPDERGIGVADARAHLDVIDALRRAAAVPGWVAEEPEMHLGPHLHAASGALAIDRDMAAPDGTFEVRLRWIGPSGPDRGSVRAAVFGMIESVAESTTLVHERREPDDLIFDVVTGTLAGEGPFASHGHTLRLRIRDPRAADRGADPND
jgi:hypothetical protein